MEILNSTLSLEKIFAEQRFDVRKAFKNQICEKKPFLPGSIFYRFLTAKDADPLGYWWYTEETRNRLISLMKLNKGTLEAVGRSKLAIKEKWNKMHYEVKIRLKTPVYGWTGIVQYQKLNDQIFNVLLMGGFNQIYLPNLTNKNISLTGPHVIKN